MRSFCSPLIALCAGVQMTPAHAARGGGGGGAGQTGPQSLAVDASGNTDPEDGFSDVVTDEGDEHKPSPPKQGEARDAQAQSETFAEMRREKEAATVSLTNWDEKIKDDAVFEDTVLLKPYGYCDHNGRWGRYFKIDGYNLETGHPETSYEAPACGYTVVRLGAKVFDKNPGLGGDGLEGEAAPSTTARATGITHEDLVVLKEPPKRYILFGDDEKDRSAMFYPVKVTDIAFRVGTHTHRGVNTYLLATYYRWSGDKELEDYGNCAQKIEVYNNAMLAKQTDIDAMIEEVTQFLQTISSDTDDHVSLVDVAGPGAEEDVDLDLAHYNK